MEKKIGRPTDYKEEYCKSIINYAKQGLFLEEIAEIYEVDYLTMWRWTKSIPLFSNAYMRAKSIIVSNLLRKLVENCHDRNFNVRAIEFVVTMITRQMQHSTVQIEGIEKGDIKEKLHAVFKALTDGKIRTDEFKNLVEGLRTSLDIEKGLEGVEMLEKAEIRMKK